MQHIKREKERKRLNNIYIIITFIIQLFISYTHTQTHSLAMATLL